MDEQNYTRLTGQTFDREAALRRLEACFAPYAGNEAMDAVRDSARRWIEEDARDGD